MRCSRAVRTLVGTTSSVGLMRSEASGTLHTVAERKEFISLVGSAAAYWPMVGRRSNSPTEGSKKASYFRLCAVCRFLGRPHHETIQAYRRQASEKRQGTQSRAGRGSVFAAAIYGDLTSASVCFREFGTTKAPRFDGLTGGGERAPPALGSGSARRRRLQDVGAASSSERGRRWLTVNGKNGKNRRRCVAVDNVISLMTYRS
jgi:hypothetical protein